MSLETCMEDISNEGATLGYPVLMDLSDLTPSELGRFARLWLNVGAERRRKVLECLVDVAEDNPEVDFCSIFKICLKDTDEIVRQKAIGGLWEFEDRSLILSLVEVLQSDESGEVRAAAAIGLGKFASLAQDGKILSKDGELVEECLMGVLKDEKEWLEVRRRALESVAHFASPDINHHIQWAYDSDDPKLKCSSLYAMGRTGESLWLSSLLSELQCANPAVRYEAATACGEIDDEEAAPYLVALLQDDDLQVQLSAIGALGKIGGSLAKRALRRCLKMEDTVLEDASREALEGIQAMEDPLSFSSEH